MCMYGNPNVTKLSKFKFKGVKVQILHNMEARMQKVKATNSRVQSTYMLHMEGCKRSNLQTQMEWTGVAN